MFLETMGGERAQGVEMLQRSEEGKEGACCFALGVEGLPWAGGEEEGIGYVSAGGGAICREWCGAVAPMLLVPPEGVACKLFSTTRGF